MGAGAATGREQERISGNISGFWEMRQNAKAGRGGGGKIHLFAETDF